MNTTQLQAQREALKAEMNNGLKTKLTQAAVKGDRDKAQALAVERLTLTAMIEALDSEIASARRRELGDELKQLNNELAVAFNAAVAARKRADDASDEYNKKWRSGLGELIPSTPDEAIVKAQMDAACAASYTEARKAGEVVDALKQRIAATQSQLEVL